MYERLIKIKQFFCEDIWRFEVSDAKGHWLKKLEAWLKTVMISARIILQKDMLSLHLPALTFSTLMATVPLLAMMFVIARGFGYDAMVEAWVGEVFKAQPEVSKTLVNFVQNYLGNTKSNYILSVGLIMMFYTLYALLNKIEKVFNTIWHAQERTWRRTFIEYPAILISFALMIGVSSFVNVMAMQIADGVDRYMGWGAKATMMLQPIAIIPTAVFFSLLFCFIPNAHVKVRSTIIPGLLSGTLMVFLQYYYILAQVWLSSYNIIYGSFAALPLFLLWLQCSWGICLFGEVLSYTIQNLHHYDSNVEYEKLDHSNKTKVCAVVLSEICKQFKEGGTAYSPRELQQKTALPQQLVNAALESLLEAHLISELKGKGYGEREEKARFCPIENIRHLTYGTLVERLEGVGKQLDDNAFAKSNVDWETIEKAHTAYINASKAIGLSE